MDYIKQYKSFINSHYWNGAIRITAGITLPAILLGFFNQLSAGIVISIGAMCVANTDNPGPIHHRRNGMLICMLIIFAVTALTSWAAGSPIWTGLLVLICCFVFSMLNIYGNRATSIGINALLVMVLNIDRPHEGWDILRNAALVLAGGAWYTLLSLLLYSFRPYKLVQQALGDCIKATAGYLRIKAAFYGPHLDYDKSYQALLESQVSVHEKQDLVRELLYKSRNIVKESTHTGRVLMMIFLDIVDLLERIMTSQQDYRMLHSIFDDSGLMEEYRRLILELASELDNIGIAVMSGRPSVESPDLSISIRRVRASFHQYRDHYRTAENVEGFIGLSNILDSIQDIADRMHTLHGYTTYDRKLGKNFNPEVDYEAFVTHQDIDHKLILENLTFKSNVFRHSLRVSIATLTGYIISLFLPFGHGYWILLTTIVILKPGYSLTKKRNYERLVGTLIGALAGLLILFFIKDRTVLFVLMIIFMIGTYVFLRTNYLVCVTFTTPYVLLLFHLLYPVDFRSILQDRVIDTAIGSALSFLANIFIIPSWEHEGITNYMTSILNANAAYFKDVANAFTGNPSTIQQYKLSRKNAFVALANLSDALVRMLSEPRKKQKKITEMHQFVVGNHMLTSHIATLAYYVPPLATKYADKAYQPLVDCISAQLYTATATLEGQPAPATPLIHKEDLRILNNRVNALMEQRKAELGGQLTADGHTRQRLSELKPIADQFNFISKVASELEKLSVPLHEGLA